MKNDSSSKKRISWAELLDDLTDSDRRSQRNRVLEMPSETQRMVLFLFRREGYTAQLASQAQKDYDLEISKSDQRTAVQISNQRSKVHLGQIEKFLDFLGQAESKRFNNGLFVSTNGFTPSVYSYLRGEKITNLRLAILQDNRLIFDAEKFDFPDERETATYIGVFTCKGGVGKTTVSAHLAGAFALNGYDVALLDLDRQQNMRKLLGEGVYLPSNKGNVGSVISVLNPKEWDESSYKETKIVVCDCNPEFDANPKEFVQKFDYCLIPTTLNPLGVNKNADVIKRTFDEIRRVNAKAHLFTLINNFHAEEVNRNMLLNQALKTQFKQFTDEDERCHYIDPFEASIRFSKQLMYWGFHIFENTRPQLAFRSIGGYSYPRMDFLKLVDYLELNTQVGRAKAARAAR
jgi:chromosome partitioning protein